MREKEECTDFDTATDHLTIDLFPAPLYLHLETPDIAELYLPSLYKYHINHFLSERARSSVSIAAFSMAFLLSIVSLHGVSFSLRSTEERLRLFCFELPLTSFFVGDKGLFPRVALFLGALC
jgi:hypothetical protein